MESDEDEFKSRSQLKREFQEIKEMVKQLIELPHNHLERMPLSPRNFEEVVAARDLSRSALQRQLRYLVRRIEQTDDIDAIREALEDPMAVVVDEPPAEPEQVDPEPHELWAQNLVAGDDQDLGRFIEEFPTVDHKKLRRLVRSATKEKAAGKGKPTAMPKLVAFLKKLSRTSSS